MQSLHYAFVVSIAFLVAASSNLAKAENLFGITDSDQLVVIDSETGMVTNTTSVSGLGLGESLIGIDMRPATGELYGFSSSSRFYKINPVSGAAAAVGGALALIDSIQAFDFDPVSDEIRIVTNWRKNIRVNPNTGGVIANESLLNYAGGDPHAGDVPQVVHAAYTNSFPGAGSATLFNLEALNDVLTFQSPQNNGTLSTVGSLGVPLSTLLAFNGMDISGSTGIAYVVGSSLLGNGLVENTLYTVNLVTGQIEMADTIESLAAGPLTGGGYHNPPDDPKDPKDPHDPKHPPHDDFGMIIDVAALPGIPEPSTFVLAACGGIALAGLARRKRARARKDRPPIA